MDADEYLSVQTQHLCVYGDPGTWKSRLAAQLAEEGYRLHYFCTDGGAPIKTLSAEARKRVKIYPILDNAEDCVAIDTFRRVIKGTPVTLCNRHGKAGCRDCATKGLGTSKVELNAMELDEIAIFDHLSGAADSAMNKVFDGEASLTKKKDDDAGSKAAYLHFRQQGWQMQDFLKRMENAPFNTVVLTHPLLVTTESGDKRLYPECGTTSFSADSGKYFGHVVLCYVENGVVKFGSLTGHKINALTKSRDNVDISKFSPPTLAPFFTPVELARGQKPALVDLKDAPMEAKEIALVTSGPTPEPAVQGETMQEKLRRLKEGK